MHVRSLVTASLVHGAIIVGVGLGVQPWITNPESVVALSIALAEPRPEVPDEIPAEEEVVPIETQEPDFVDPECAPPVAESPTTPDEAADLIDEVDPRFATPTVLPPSRDLLMRVRPLTPRPPAVVEPVAAEPSPLREFVAAEAIDERNKPPTYPDRASRLELEATVVLLVTVDVHGEVRKVELLKPAGLTPAHKEMNRAAIAAICRWHYRPALRRGRPVEAVIKVPVEFRIRPR